MNEKLRVLSYNIHKGVSTLHRRYLLEGIRHAIRNIDADLVFLQEVIGEHSHHQKKFRLDVKLPQFEFLADQVWPHFSYGKNAVYQRGHHGNAILSKHPFKQTTHHDISRWRFSKRGILHGLILNKVHVYCVHFGLFNKERHYQLEQLIAVIKTTAPRDAPIIIAGDFNDWNREINTQLYQRLKLKECHLETHGHLAKTFPAFFPLLAMDRIYTRGCEISHATTLSGPQWWALSDHRALFTELTIL